jgi:hypothetical protein
MRLHKGSATVLCLLALGVHAAEVTSGELSFNLRDETAPAGSIVQMKAGVYEVTPISGGRPRVAFAPGSFDVLGVGLFAPAGQLAGAAVPDGNQVAITYVTTAPSGDEQPILTVSLRLRPDLAAGARALVTLEPSIWNLDGTIVTSRRATATVTVGGSVAVTEVVPGDGWFPAGTVVSVRGVGFFGDTRLRFNGTRIRNAQVVSATEIQFTLAQATNMAGAEFRIDNPDSRATYYSYLRGTPAATSQRLLLSITEPIFSGGARSLATFGPIPAMNGDFQYAALALQNPNLDRADMTLELYAADGTLLQSSPHSLESGYRLALELSELFDGVAAPPGASVRVTSSLPVQAFGLFFDERIRTITPRLPAEATP